MWIQKKDEKTLSTELLLRYLSHGWCASKVIKKTGVDKGYLSRRLTQLEQAGYIVCSNPKGKPKFYELTKKLFKKNDKLTKLTPNKLTRSCGRHEVIKVQKSSFKFEIVTPPAIKVKWDKEYYWSNNNSVIVQQYRYPFKDTGEVLFKRFIGKEIDRLLIILPQLLIPENEINSTEAFLTEIATRAGAWIQKQFKMRLGLPEICQKPHFAVPAREPELVKAFTEGSYKVGEIMGDSSPPDRIPEFESTNKEDVVNYMHSINEIKFLKEEMRLLKATMLEMTEDMHQMLEVQKDYLSQIKELTGMSDLDKNREIDNIERGMVE